MAENINWVEKVFETRQWFSIAADDSHEQGELVEHVVNTEVLSA